MAKITMEHGSGGAATAELIEGLFKDRFGNEYLDKMEDSSVVPGYGRLSVTTDSFVVRPLFYDGGDIGRLSVCGTVNDLLMSGGVPRYLTAGFVLEEGLDTGLLEKVVDSMAETAKEAGVCVVAGDTKVVESSGGEGGLIINTAGVGFVDDGISVGARFIQPGDAVILSGNLGDHHAAIMKYRLNIKNDLIKSDNAPLNRMVRGLVEGGIRVHALRDVTRGGLGTVLNEFAKDSGSDIVLEENSIPVSPAVRDFSALLGLDIMYMGNEGKMVCAVASEDRDRALQIIRDSEYGENAALIGEVRETTEKPLLIMRTAIGGKRAVPPLFGEGLPRIC